MRHKLAALAITWAIVSVLVWAYAEGICKAQDRDEPVQVEHLLDLYESVNMDYLAEEAGNTYTVICAGPYSIQTPHKITIVSQDSMLDALEKAVKASGWKEGEQDAQ